MRAPICVIDPLGIGIWDHGENRPGVFYISVEQDLEIPEFKGTLEQAKIAGLQAFRKYHQKLADEAAQEIFKSFGM